MGEPYEVRVCRVGDGTERVRALGVTVVAVALVVYALASRAPTGPVPSAAPSAVAAVSTAARTGIPVSRADDAVPLPCSPEQAYQAWLDYRAGERAAFISTPRPGLHAS